MSEASETAVAEALLDWHEVAALKVFTTFSDRGTAGVVELFAALAAERDAITAQLWEVAAFLMDRAPVAEQEFVGDELAAAMNVHPATGQRLAFTAAAAMELPALMEAMQRGEIGERHVVAALEVLSGTVPRQLRDEVTHAVVGRLRRRAEDGRGWPTPGGLRRELRRELARHDLPAAQERERAATDRRGIRITPLPDGQALLGIEGPAAQVVAMHEALLAAGASAAGASDPRGLDARRFDAAFALLTSADATAVGAHRIEVQVIVPFSTAQGGDLELADLAGYGPILPSTARDLLSQADSVRRVCVDACSGAVLAVDDAVRIDNADREAALQRAIASMATDPVLLRDLSTAAYRPTLRLLRHIRLRDRTCAFPGCTRPARWTDADHREPWPRGATDEANLHCLCRHHHRAKQARFTVTTDPDGTRVWTSTSGKVYRRPPSEW